MMDIDDARTAYRSDPQFRQLVDSLEYASHNLRLTPHEIRAAAVLACINHEMRNPRPAFISDDAMLKTTGLYP